MLLQTEVLILEVMITFESVTYIRTVLPTSSVTLLVALVRHRHNLKYALGKHLSEVLAQDRKTKDDSQKPKRGKKNPTLRCFG